MAKKRTDREASRDLILNAALRAVRRSGASGVTVASVAAEAGCAKGLVHYHFHTKQELWQAVATALAEERIGRWKGSFIPGRPAETVQKTWDLLINESRDGTMLAWTSLLGPGSDAPGSLVSKLAEDFGNGLGEAFGSVLDRHGVRARVSASDIGWLLASVISGAGFLLLAGVDRSVLEDAYSAAWLGVLSMTE